MLDRNIILYTSSLLAGILLGIALVQLSATEVAQDNSKYCQSVEEAIQDNMSQGFVNCVDPNSVQVNISDKVQKKSELRCVCRKRTDAGLQVLKVTTANSQ